VKVRLYSVYCRRVAIADFTAQHSESAIDAIPFSTLSTPFPPSTPLDLSTEHDLSFEWDVVDIQLSPPPASPPAHLSQDDGFQAIRSSTPSVPSSTVTHGQAEGDHHCRGDSDSEVAVTGRGLSWSGNEDAGCTKKIKLSTRDIACRKEIITRDIAIGTLVEFPDGGVAPTSYRPPRPQHIDSTVAAAAAV